VFEAFVRGDASRGSDGGTGLGLTIAKKVMEWHTA
jgi:signal transduction histidine kinase